MGYVCIEVTHYHVVLLYALLVVVDSHIADCTAETLAIENVVKLGWMVDGVVCDKMQVSLEPGVVDTDTIDFDEFQNFLPFCKKMILL